MKNVKKRILSLLVMLMLLMNIAVPTLAINKIGVGQNQSDHIVVDIEGLTLGQGLYVEPTLMSYDEIINIYNTNTGEHVERQSVTAAHALVALLYSNGLEWKQTGSVAQQSFYLSAIKGIDKGSVDIPAVIAEQGNVSNENNCGNDDEYLGEFDYGGMSGWMITVDNFLVDCGSSAWVLDEEHGNAVNADQNGTHVIRWQFSVDGYGVDLGVSSGWGNSGYFDGADKGALCALYSEIAKFDESFFVQKPAEKAAALVAFENLTATQGEVDACFKTLADAYKQYSSTPSAIDYKIALNATLSYLASTVTEPTMGTFAGEWTVLSLARGEHYALNDQYFAEYYGRIEKYVEENIIEVSPGVGIFHKVKSTENSRLIMALSAIGKDSTNVNGWDLVEALSDMTFIQKQPINAAIFALIALDTYGYSTTNQDIRTELIDNLLKKEILNADYNGGWALSGSLPDSDTTAMAMQSLAPYYETNENVKAAVDRGVAILSQIQQSSGGYASWGTVNAESCAQVIVTLTTLGIEPATDARFIKDGHSVIEALLGFYVEGGGFKHIDDGKIGAMATDQSAYALVAYDRFLNSKTSLYDMTDVRDTYDQNGFLHVNAVITVPEILSNQADTVFNASVALSNWDSTKDYKLMDCIVLIPDGVSVIDVVASNHLSGGKIYYEYEKSTNKLRVVYSNLDTNSNIAVSGKTYPTELFSVSMKLDKTIDVAVDPSLEFRVSGMSLKLGVDSTDATMMHVIDTTTDSSVDKTKLQSQTAVYAYELYTGDGVDLIGTDKQAVALLVTEIPDNTVVTYVNGTEFMYSAELTQKTGVVTFVAMFSTEVSVSTLNMIDNYNINMNTAPKTITFGDVNYDNAFNAQDALDTVNAWLRKTGAPTDSTILAMNINGDSRINTFDALGIVDSFVNGTELPIVSFANGLHTAVQ